MGPLPLLLWDSTDGWLQSLLLLIVWIHSCMGLHYWLHLTPWWRPALPYMIGLAFLVPAFALAGFMVEGCYMQALFQDDATRAALMDAYKWPTPEIFATLCEISNTKPSAR